MEDPNLIVTLIPADEQNYAENAFRYDENKDRCLPPTRKIEEEGPAISSREATPARPLQADEEQEVHDDPETKHRIRLTFYPPPKDPAKGYAFGTDRQKCDVYLGPRGIRDTSGVHFHITFDVIRGERRLVLRDSSTNGTAVSYNGQAEEEVRHHFPWILNLDKDNGKWKVNVHVRGLVFKVEWASHKICEVEYKKNMTAFLKLSQTADPPLGGLSIDSHITEVAPSQSRTPGQRPVYIHEEPLGRGSFGQVDKVIDVSTGAVYAQKTFYEPPWAKRRRYQREEWLDQIRREIRIMREHPHEHIVPILDFQIDPRPFFIMPYFPMGSLSEQHRPKPLAEGDSADILFQGLWVLGFLHSRGVAYRDLKPDNILVEYRSCLHLQFTDFGLANDQPDLNTFCGTEIYCAPEIYSGKRYTTKVDIWSLGVIVLEFGYGLPTQQPQRRPGRTTTGDRGLAWCRRLVEYANDRESDPLIDLLTSGMLRIEARQRLSASECIKRVENELPFCEPPAGSRDPTTTPTRAPASAVRNEEETPTVIEGALWEAGTTPANSDDDQAGRFASDRYSTTSAFRQLDVPGSQNNVGVPRPRKETPKAASRRSSGRVRSSTGPPSPHNTRLMFSGSKRHRSPAVNSPNNPSEESSRVKRRPPEAPFTQVRASCAPKIPLSLDSIHEVVQADAEHLQMKINGQVVLMQEVDCYINVTQIIKLTGKTKNERDRILRCFKATTKVALRPAWGTHGGLNTWASIQHGQELCVKLGLAGKLQPLLDRGLDLRRDRSSDKSLVGRKPVLLGRKPVLRDPANALGKPPFIIVSGRFHQVLVRQLDWRINSTSIANQVKSGDATQKLRQRLDPSTYDIVRGNCSGTYVDFDLGIKWCREIGLNDLANQLLHLRPTEYKQAVDVQQDPIASPVLEDPADLPHTVPVSSRSVNSDPVRAPAMAGRSCSKSPANPDGSVDAGDGGNLTGGFFSEEGRLTTTVNVRPRTRESNKPSDAVSMQQSNNEAEKNHPHYTEGNSYRDFMPRDSQLQEVKLGLQIPSRTSSRYGTASMWSGDLGFDVDETDM